MISLPMMDTGLVKRLSFLDGKPNRSLVANRGGGMVEFA